MYNQLLIFLCLIFPGSLFVSCERLHEQIYSSISGGAACFRRLNGTHQTGCSSSEKGTVGVVQIIKDVSDAQWLVYNATPDSYIAVVSTSQFLSVVELFMEHPDNIAGVLVFENITDSAAAFSHESRCPNEYSAADGSTCSSVSAGGIVWNEKGTGLLRRDIPFPMLYLPESHADEIKKIEQCYERYNLDKNNQENRPLCAIQLHSFMFAAVNSELCLRRSASSALLTATKVCDPLGDLNVYYSLFPRVDKELNNKTVTLVTARIDTATLFDGISPGAASSVVGMTTLLTAAVTLARMIPAADAQSYDHNVLFTLLNGEAFDYIGSQRVAYDMRRGAWPAGAPLAPAAVSLHVELGQLGGALAAHASDTTWPLYAFAPYDINSQPPQVTDFLLELSKNLGMNISAEFTKNLPPSSLHSFRRILKNATESLELPEVLLVDHQQTFTNNFYHSVLDGLDKIDFVYHNISVDTNGVFVPTSELIAQGIMKETDTQVKISRLSTALAQTLYRRVTGTNYIGNETASAHLVDEMLYCFLSSQACRLLVAADFDSDSEVQMAARPAPLYVSVAQMTGTAPLFAGHMLALLASRPLPLNRTACQTLNDPGLSYFWLSGWNHSGVCIQTTMNFSQAISPAFTIPGYDMSIGEYSTWTESVWHSMWARVFVRAGGGGARGAAAAGGLAAVLAAVITIWLRRHAHLIFLHDSLSGAGDDVTAGILRTANC